MPKILSFHNELVKYPLYKKLKDNWDAQDRFVKSTIIITVLLIIATPAIVGAYLSLSQNASNANRKIFMGISTHESTGPKRFGGGVDVPGIEAELELIKRETGSYPAVYALFLNLTTGSLNIPLLNIFNYLDSKGIAPAIYLMPVSGEMERRDGRYTLSTDSNFPITALNTGEIRFDSTTPSAISKIYVSKTANGTENPNQFLVPTWLNGQTIEVLGSQLDSNNIDYDSKESFKFEIIADITSVAPDNIGYWEISVRPIRTTTFDKAFTPGNPVFISPSNVLAKKYFNANIAKGDLDDKFRVYADAVKQYGKPVLFRYAWEMNVELFPWSEGGNNKKLKFDSSSGIKGYERFRYFDMGNTPDNYVKSWRQLHRLIKPIAPNLRFFWCPLNSKTDRYEPYFPGEEFVDYVGFDAYSGISSYPHKSLVTLADAPVRELKRLSQKPIIIGETGINSIAKEGDPFPPDNLPNYRRKWIREVFPELRQAYPRIVGIMYFNLDMRPHESSNNWLLSNAFSVKENPDDIPEIINAYRSLLLNPHFQGKFEGNDTVIPTDPIGFHDVTSCEVSSGWTCDADDFTMGLDVEFYADSAKDSGGTYLGKVNASSVREQAVGGQCGGNVNHGFTFTTPETLKDGRSHKVFAYAKDDSRNSSTLLSSSPRNITCGGTGGQEKITVNLTAIEDTYVSSASKTQSYGRSIYLKADATPVQRTFIKFNTSLYRQKTIDKVILELTVSNAQEADSGLVKGIDFRVVPNTWSENTLNYNTPLVLGEVLSTFNGSKTQGQKVRVDLTNYVKTHMGVVSFAIVNRGGNSIFFNSKEVSANKPILKVTYR